MKYMCRFLFSIFRNLPSSQTRFFGKAAKKMRALAAKGFVRSCGKNVNIEHGAIISSKLSTGDNSGVGIDCVCAGELVIGNDVMMEPDIICSRNHAYSDSNIPMRLQGYTKEEPCSIGDDVWIARKVMIMPGITIGKGLAIAAGAVVTKDVPEFAAFSGNPGKVIKAGGSMVSNKLFYLALSSFNAHRIDFVF